MMNRRDLLKAAPALALPLAPRHPAGGDPGAPVPTLDPRDPLSVLARHYAALLDHHVAIEARYEGLIAAGDHAAVEAFEDATWEPSLRQTDRAEKALRDALTARKVPLLVAGGRLFVNTCYGFVSFGADMVPQYVYVFPLPGGPADDAPAGGVLFDLDDVVESEEAGATIRLTFEVGGDQADEARRWLALDTGPLDVSAADA